MSSKQEQDNEHNLSIILYNPENSPVVTSRGRKRKSKSLVLSPKQKRGKGRPRFTCDYCKSKKLKCDEFRPCLRCVKLGITDECADENESSAPTTVHNVPAAANAVSSSSSSAANEMVPRIDFTEFFEECFKKYPVSDEFLCKWMVTNPSSWYVEVFALICTEC